MLLIEKRVPTFAKFETLSWPQLGFDAVSCSYDPKAFADCQFELCGIPFDPSLRRAIPVRKAEYLAGRLCASQALAKIGAYGAVKVDPDRSPRWPAGTVGSISHSANCAIAAALPAAFNEGVGIDIECRSAFADAALDQTLFLTDAERAVVSQSAFPDADHALLIFSLKESFFKFAYPQVRQYFGFFSVALSKIDTIRQIVTLDIKTKLGPKLSPGRQVSGAYKLLGNSLLATAVCEQYCTRYSEMSPAAKNRNVIEGANSSKA